MAGWADSAWSPLQLNTTNWGQNTSHPRCYSTIITQGLVDLVRSRRRRCGVLVGLKITIAVMTAMVAAVIDWRVSGHSLPALPSH